jgi:hypothetical protein
LRYGSKIGSKIFKIKNKNIKSELEQVGLVVLVLSSEWLVLALLLLVQQLHKILGHRIHK